MTPRTFINPKILPKPIADKLVNVVFEFLPEAISVEDMASVLVALRMVEEFLKDYMKKEGFDLEVGVMTVGDTGGKH